MKDKLDQILQQARTAAPVSETAADASLPPGLSTRIAARWSTCDDKASAMALLERVTAFCLLPVLATWAVLAWNAAGHEEPNLIDLLYTARLVVETPPPF